MSNKQKTPSKTEIRCSHIWICSTADGPTSPAECRLCHEKRDFLNFFPDFNKFVSSKRRNGYIPKRHMGA
jgi:hypothetical protein